MKRYHDLESGAPCHDDHTLFEFLILDGAQAGLSWQIILNRHVGYRRAFHRFNARRIAAYDRKDVARLLQDPGIIRNRLKIESAITNARAFLQVQKESGSFDSYIWSFVGGQPIIHRHATWKGVPATSPESDAMSKGLKHRGFKFVGSTICYSFMQAAGLVNDHLITCPRYGEVGARA